ncbi:MAG TPA: hypothetical protein VHT48_05460, partial [Methylocella sp.]|nr:hypothetical protein [Methylocella sp.]
KDVLNLDHSGGPYDLTEANRETGYHPWPGTLAEQAVIAFFKANPTRVAGKRLLHLGIGKFGWSTAKRLANTPCVSVGEAARSWRILGEQGVQQLGERYGLALEKHAVRGVAHWHGQFDLSGEPEIADESLCCFAKADWFEAALHVISVRRRLFPWRAQGKRHARSGPWKLLHRYRSG